MRREGLARRRIERVRPGARDHLRFAIAPDGDALDLAAGEAVRLDEPLEQPGRPARKARVRVATAGAEELDEDRVLGRIIDPPERAPERVALREAGEELVLEEPRHGPRHLARVEEPHA